VWFTISRFHGGTKTLGKPLFLIKPLIHRDTAGWMLHGHPSMGACLLEIVMMYHSIVLIALALTSDVRKSRIVFTGATVGSRSLVLPNYCRCPILHHAPFIWNSFGLPT
jgi:hypothetical protein